jgi:hypothetical protein
MVGVVKPRGPHHFASSSGSVHALNTVEGDARKTRFIRSASSLGCTVITRLLVDAVAAKDSHVIMRRWDRNRTDRENAGALGSWLLSSENGDEVSLLRPSG